ncbi:MAG: acyltransferase [Moorea sp. SIO1G6]|uniref:acyltransferase family protein n=1 Tax=Moorena sp. SIO1G6 TaxID=2607840 RepID=UPI0013C07A48|nr:acyltransferase family protein [Moorena sp. SIO1G6]NES81084.1 acyltransferase [Moorena sp. SIO2B7]NET62935.1 acyltransferase [Moorena sp. SIO1G6]
MIYKNRFFFIDILKALSITAVVSYHSVFVPYSTYASSALLIDILFAPLRFCVPVFLTISFLLLQRGLTNRPNQSVLVLLNKRLSRLAIPTAFWFSLAAVLKLATGNSPLSISIAVLTGEIFTGAYYLLIMFQLIPIFVLAKHYIDSFKTLMAALLLQIIIFVVIQASLAGIIAPEITTFLKIFHRIPLFYWFAYIALGAYFYHKLPLIRKKSAHTPAHIKVLLLLLSGLLMMAEYSWLGKITAGNVPPFEYIMFSCLISVPVAFLCFSCVEAQKFPLLVTQSVTILSRYSLGIFCINGLVSQILLSLGGNFFAEATFDFSEILVIKVLGWFFLLAISLCLSVLLDKIGLKSVVC